MRVTKKEIAQRLAQRLDLQASEAQHLLDETLETIYEAIKAGESVTLTNFGSFYVKQKRDSTVFRFNPSQRLRAVFGWSSTYRGEI